MRAKSEGGKKRGRELTDVDSDLSGTKAHVRTQQRLFLVSAV